MTPRWSVANLWHAAKNRIQTKTKVGLAVLVIATIPKWAGIAKFWYSFGLTALPTLKKLYGLLNTTWAMLVLLALGFLLIALDQRRITRVKQDKHDPNTLRGRTLQLRDDLQAFLNSAPALVGNQTQDESREQYLKRALEASSRRTDYLVHGYEWRFSQRALDIHHQFGEFGISDSEVDDALLRQFKNDDSYQMLIRGLARLAETPEGVTGVSNSGFDQMSYQDYREGRERGVF